MLALTGAGIHALQPRVCMYVCACVHRVVPAAVAEPILMFSFLEPVAVPGEGRCTSESSWTVRGGVLCRLCSGDRLPPLSRGSYSMGVVSRYLDDDEAA